MSSLRNSHNLLRLPDNGVSVEVLGGIEPKIKLLLSVAFSLREDIGMKNVRLPTYIAQELKVNLVMICPL